jgi:sulfate/thiosulfate transport system substrate-binding protein
MQMYLDRILSWTGLALAFFVVLAVVFGAGQLRAAEPTTLLNASYDVSRELYKDINDAFVADWKKKTGETVTINQSHGGSTKQALAVANGLEADVVTFNQAPDIDVLVKTGGLVAADWRSRFPNGASPYTTTSIFLVRKGNPKGIKDWDDLAKPGIEVIVPNPKTSGNGRYTYLAAWGYALRKTGSEAGAREFVHKLFGNVPVLDGGGRGATTTFTQRGKGDVLVTFENEADLVAKEFGADKFDVVYPKLSIKAEPPVAIVDKVVDKRGSRKLAEAYLNFLYSPEAQAIIAKHHLRPRDESVLKANASAFPPIETFAVEEVLGGWDKVQKDHFADGATYDQIAIKQ